MENKFKIKPKKAFTFIELLIVVALIGIVSAMVLSSYRISRAQKEVEVAARGLAAVIREAQNSSLTGKRLTCAGSSVMPNSYKIRIYNETPMKISSFFASSDSACTNHDDNEYSVTKFKNVINNKDGLGCDVTTDCVVTFSVPFGNRGALGYTDANGNAKILLQSTSYTSAYYTVCVYISGNVEEKLGNVAC
ncbi:MAG: type II secretion system protein [Parcubacteria group bacterium]